MQNNPGNRRKGIEDPDMGEVIVLSVVSCQLSGDNARIANLSAGFGIKGCIIQNN